MFLLLSFVIPVIGLFMVLGQVLAHRDQPKDMLQSIVPGLAVFVAGLTLPHLFSSHLNFGSLLQLFFFVSILGAFIMTVKKAISPETRVPGKTIPLAFVDTMILQFGTSIIGQNPDHSPFVKGAEAVFGLMVVAWFLGKIIEVATSPIRARRRREADAALAQYDDLRMSNEDL